MESISFPMPIPKPPSIPFSAMAMLHSIWRFANFSILESSTSFAKAKMFSTEKIDELGISIIKDLFFKEVKKKYSDIFKETDEIKLKDETIYSIVKILQPYNLKNTNIDVKGRAYEILLGKTITLSVNINDEKHHKSLLYFLEYIFLF